ncbi:MAG: hypothetical protein GTO02_12740 [Candidatus Dadabacteria bacterium]|nr:hypothetical protein [Candidatus Dadabacteria bacterium]NIQ15217.1 hypothetical protein [Candidatus Dadabacteria bacterium]
MAIYTNFELSLISKAKAFLKANPEVDFDTLAEEFISKYANVDEMTVIDCLSEAHEQLSE